jgi:DNA-binding NtrC family response regulator
VQWRLLIIGRSDSRIDHCIQELGQTIPGVSAQHVEWTPLATIPIPMPELAADMTLLLADGEERRPADLLQAMLTRSYARPSIAVLPEGADSSLIRLASQATDDFVFAPIRPSELCHRVVRLLGRDVSATGTGTDATHASVSRLKEKLVQQVALAGFVGRDPAFLKTVDKIPVVARSPGPVLIVGETGTGKELCARAVHSLGPRSSYPFIPVDCATLPDHLFESEVFGHVSGAFTDARRDQKGLVALAQGGTLFLDEINSLSLPSQSKLLRFLQERTYRPLGASTFAKASVNIVAATNCDLEILVRDKLFRSDLFFRLNVFRLDLAPLRERRDDIALLALHYTNVICAEHGLTHKTLALCTLRRLQEHDWPGNVRELYNTIQRALIFSSGPVILPSDISEEPDKAVTEDGFRPFRQARMHAIESFERRYVEDLMRQCDGNVSRAARLAKKDRRAFGRLVKRYHISR